MHPAHIRPSEIGSSAQNAVESAFAESAIHKPVRPLLANSYRKLRSRRPRRSSNNDWVITAWGYGRWMPCGNNDSGQHAVGIWEVELQTPYIAALGLALKDE